MYFSVLFSLIHICVAINAYVEADILLVLTYIV